MKNSTKTVSEFDSHCHFDSDSDSESHFVFDFYSDWDSVFVLNMILMWILLKCGVLSQPLTFTFL